MENFAVISLFNGKTCLLFRDMTGDTWQGSKILKKFLTDRHHYFMFWDMNNDRSILSKNLNIGHMDSFDIQMLANLIHKTSADSWSLSEFVKEKLEVKMEKVILKNNKLDYKILVEMALHPVMIFYLGLCGEGNSRIELPMFKMDDYKESGSVTSRSIVKKEIKFPNLKQKMNHFRQVHEYDFSFESILEEDNHWVTTLTVTKGLESVVTNGRGYTKSESKDETLIAFFNQLNV